MPIEQTSSRIANALEENELLRAECAEQARLLGMSGEREMKFRAEIEALTKEIEYLTQHNEMVRRNAIDDVMYRLSKLLKSELREGDLMDESAVKAAAMMIDHIGEEPHAQTVRDMAGEIYRLRARVERLEAENEGISNSYGNAIRQLTRLRAHVEAVAKYAYAQGYGRGHDDTVEACFGDADEIAADWFVDAVADGAIDALREGE